MRKFLPIAALFFVLPPVACGGRNLKEYPETMSASAEFKGAKFSSYRPSVGDSLQESLAPSVVENLGALKDDSEFLKSNPSFRVEIVGFTDDRECIAQDCDALSLRRAKIVYDWFLSQGVMTHSLKPPEGLGNRMAIGDNNTEEGRQRNRRVEVNLIVED
ncbi:OmpA family protein [Tahibacter soli]|uniref:OmpA family protein n=1 Tax=Tahibacter soli TaxID=2983605 RepID=A0A9X3YNU0_9GAMM|nr:OmpA family protein [Tahibacter soli]MDC8014665.1 OmpA family protein [Tahibacter soli]